MQERTCSKVCLMKCSGSDGKHRRNHFTFFFPPFVFMPLLYILESLCFSLLFYQTRIGMYFMTKSEDHLWLDSLLWWYYGSAVSGSTRVLLSMEMQNCMHIPYQQCCVGTPVKQYYCGPRVPALLSASFCCQFLCSAYALMFCVIYYNIRMREIELAMCLIIQSSCVRSIVQKYLLYTEKFDVSFCRVTFIMVGRMELTLAIFTS